MNTTSASTSSDMDMYYVHSRRQFVDENGRIIPPEEAKTIYNNGEYSSSNKPLHDLAELNWDMNALNDQYALWTVAYF